MIIVTGSTGTVGTQLLKTLSAQGAKVRVLVLPEEVHLIKLPGVEVASGDYTKPETVAPALRGIQKMFLLTHLDERQLEIQNNLVDLAKTAGVKHIVKFSVYTAEEDSPLNLSRWHYQNEKYIERSGLAYTILHPHTFMQTIGMMFASTIIAEGVMYASVGEDKKISMVDVRDVAAVAAKVLTGTGHEGKTYLITGPEAISYQDVAEKLSAAIGKRVRYAKVLPSEAREKLAAQGFPGWLVESLLTLFAMYDTGKLNPISSVVQELAGRSAITFDQFAKDYVDVFKGV